MLLLINTIKDIYEINVCANLPVVFNKSNYYNISTLLVIRLNNNIYINGYDLYEHNCFSKDISSFNKITYISKPNFQLLDVL